MMNPVFKRIGLLLVGVPILVSLGIWQLHRADEKRSIQANLALRSQMPPITLERAEQLRDANYYLVNVEGYFLNQSTLLLDNQFHNHRLGYQVITPFIVNQKQWLLVNRGWLPAGSNRHQLPRIPKVLGKVRLSGLLYTPQKNPFSSTQIEMTQPVWRAQSIAIAQLSEQLHHPLLPFALLLAQNSPYGFIYHWQPINTKAAMHKGYAVQWFALAFVFGVMIMLPIGRKYLKFKR
jgi:Uncharacterized conserved protein